MASMKTRVLQSLNTIIAEYEDQDACDQQNAKLQALGAPASLIAQNIERQVAMREELPRMFAFIAAEFNSRDSLNTIITRTGAEGYSNEALYAIRPEY